MQEQIASGLLAVLPPTPVTMEELPEAHQAMWENRHQGANYVAVHALPREGLKTKDELYYEAYESTDYNIVQVDNDDWQKLI